MKKFLLLIVGVLFALSANAVSYTVYADITKTGWTTTPTLYAGEWNKDANDGKGAANYWVGTEGEHLYNNIYKFTFNYGDGKDNYRIIFSSDASYGTNPANPGGQDLSKKLGTDAFYGEISVNKPDNDNWKLVNNRLYVLAPTNQITSVTDNFTPTAAVDIYIAGQSIGWLDTSNAANSRKLTRTGEYTYQYVFTDNSFPTGDAGKFLICRGNNYDNDNKWGSNDSKLSANTEYTLKKGGGDIYVESEIVNPTVIVDISDNNKWKVTFKTTTTDPDPTDPTDPVDPTDEYVYKLHTDLVNGSWNTYDMFKQADGTWAWAGQLYLTGSDKAFCIKKVKGNSDAEIWCISKSDTDYTLSDGSKVGAVIKDGENGHDFQISEAGFYQIVFNPSEEGMTVTLTKLNNTLEFTYAVRGDILGDGWKDYKMGKVPGSNWWYLEGKFQSGEFGIKKLDKNGDQYVYEGHNEWGWIHSLENAAITLGTWNKAVVKGYYPDTDPNTKGVGNWKLSGLATGTKYTIMFDAENMQILVSPVAASGVEDINVDEDAPVEYFNLQGQRVNGELTPGIYIRRQGSTVTKVRF